MQERLAVALNLVIGLPVNLVLGDNPRAEVPNL